MSSFHQAAFALVAAAFLSACSQQNDRTALTQTCVDQGESLEACTCITAAMEEKLSPTLFKRSVQVVARERRDVEEFIMKLPADQQKEYSAALNDMFSCKLAPPVETAPATDAN